VLDLLYIEIVDEINSAAVICFEFNGKKCQWNHNFPKLSENQKSKYRG
jgi:hypothetical protein